ncbi:hypothetical protein A2155_00485 [candidate division WWE3 bacterium RBG_16_52_45]|nr:MAG: hypothetical protein A2155_00485 [candidate division WWE3 bacterium RBG_16_52_45]
MGIFLRRKIICTHAGTQQYGFWDMWVYFIGPKYLLKGRMAVLNGCNWTGCFANLAIPDGA